MATDSYSVYLRSFAKAASGAKITEADFLDGALPEILDLPGQAAVALAVQDVAKDAALKSKAEFEAEVNRLLSKPLSEGQASSNLVS